MDIEVHRAGRTFYVHSTALLNVPQRRLESFFELPHWSLIAAARFLGLDGFRDKRFEDFAGSPEGANGEPQARVPVASIEELMRRHDSGELSPEEFVTEMRSLQDRGRQEEREETPEAVRVAVEGLTGVRSSAWEKCGQELIEQVMPLENGQVSILSADVTRGAQNRLQELIASAGIARISLVSDFPITTASYGYTRGEYAPNVSRLNAFPPSSDYGARIPIYVDQVQADAILVEVDPARVCAWLARNGVQAALPQGSDAGLSQRAYAVQLLEDAPLWETLRGDRAAARAVFGLLHTLSHYFLRQAALLCGLERTSLSEYVLPRTLTFAIYCNHRFGATIGALTALFEQSLEEWLISITSTRHCVYDPVCKDREGSCHACTHLSETSCRYFNLNLGRAFLFGGPDPEIGRLQRGYFDSSPTTE